MSKNFEEFKEISNLLEEELKNFDSINDEIIDQQNDIKKIRENYTKYNNLINKGNSHVRDMERRELYEFLFLYFAYIFFWCWNNQFFCFAYFCFEFCNLFFISLYLFCILHWI